MASRAELSPNAPSERSTLRSILLIATGGAMVALAAAAWVNSRTAERTSRELSELKRELGRVSSTKEQVRTIIREVRTEAPVPSPSAPAETPTTPEERESAAEERQERGTRYHEARMSRFEEEHAAEPEDTEWSRAATQVIANAYSGPDFQALRLTTVCKTTLCRTDFSYTDPLAGPTAVYAFTRKQPWDGKRATAWNQETHLGTSYFARETFDLPYVELPR